MLAIDRLVMFAKPQNSWHGNGEEEVGIDINSDIVRVRVDSKLYRPLDVPYLHRCAEKARLLLGWTTTIAFESLVREMVQADLAKFKKTKLSGSKL